MALNQNLNTTAAGQMAPRQKSGPPESTTRESMSVNQNFKTIKAIAHLMSNGGGIDRMPKKKFMTKSPPDDTDSCIAPKALNQGRTDLASQDPNRGQGVNGSPYSVKG